MTILFNQLGLASRPVDIEIFLEDHRPLADDLKLEEAPFWTASQASLLQEQMLQDADWVGIIDRLDSDLRVPFTDVTCTDV